MSLFDEASLIVTPNAFKASKLFSIKPTDGSGDLSAVRATSATIPKNAQGLVEVPRTNLFLRSEEFDNTYWVKANSAVIANQIISPNGTLTSDKLIASVGVSDHVLRSGFSITPNTNYTLTVFAKKSEYNFFVVRRIGSVIDTYFNLNNGTLGNVGSGVVASILNVGDGWYRCSVTFTPTTGTVVDISLSNTNGVISYNGDGTSGIFIWGAQLEVGSTATEYIPTVASIRTKFAGITQDGSSASNIPRLDYTNGSCPSILVEPQRTNLALRSEEFDNAYWVKSAASIAANSITSPNDTITADKLIEDTSASAHRFISTSFSTLTGVSYTVSIFLKKAGRDYAYIRLNNSGGDIIAANINLLNGTVSQSIFGNITIVPYNNDWYRVIATGTSISTSSGSFEVRTSNSATYANYTGNGTSGIFVWGAQLEAGSNATSYIPTQGSTVTRNADVISKTGISSLIGQTEGTIFFDIQTVNTENIKAISINSVDFNNYIYYYESTNNYYFIIVSGGVSLTLPFAGVTLPSRKKIALRYSQNNFSMWINGVKRVEKLEAFNPPSGLNKMQFMNPFNQPNTVLDSKINSVLLFKTALSNTELSQLTTI
jgi:hypothetical protein